MHRTATTDFMPGSALRQARLLRLLRTTTLSSLLVTLGLAFGVSSCRRATPPPDPTAVAQAVQATLTALPTPTARLIEVTRVVAVPQVVLRTTPLPAMPALLVADTLQTIGLDAKPATQTLEQAVAQIINQERRAHGLAPLQVVPALEQAARRHSSDMAAHNLMAHEGSDGSTAGERISAAGYQWDLWSETIAWGIEDAQEVVAWFLDSNEHRMALLSAHFTDFGVALTEDANSVYKRYWTVTFATMRGFMPSPVNDTPDTALIAPDDSTAVTTPMTVDPVCPATSHRQYDLIPMTAVDQNHPDQLHGDLSLAQRGYVASAQAATLIEQGGETDGDPPQLAGLFAAGSRRAFTSVHQVYDWQWSCGEHGCRGDRLTLPEVTLLGIATTPGEAVQAPSRRAEIFGGGYMTAVLYAEATRLTLGYTRDGSVANGYAIHLEGICVDPNLVARYQAAQRAGRNSLPALRRDEVLGSAAGAELLVATRDRGRFLDPRSRKDWWQAGQ